MEKLRKVIFTLAVPGLSIMDYDIEDPSIAEEKMREREGLFHALGNDPFWDTESSCWRDRTVGYVEEVSTGKIHKVYPENIKFIKDER